MVVRADDDRVTHALGFVERPLQRALAAERAADHKGETLETQQRQGVPFGAHDVAHAQPRKRFARLRTGGPVTTAQRVDRDDAPIARVEQRVLADDAGPPLGNATRTGQRVFDQDDVGAVGFRRAVDRDALFDGP